MAKFYQLKAEQIVHGSLEQVWDFISSPKNLKEITPDYMGFEIKTDLVEKMYPGIMIGYYVKPLLGIPMTWLTEITHVVDHHFFVDEQRIGPYQLWHHQHILERIDDTTVRMKDVVTYQLPLGILGKIAHRLFVKKQLASIFDYRTQKVNELFPVK